MYRFILPILILIHGLVAYSQDGDFASKGKQLLTKAVKQGECVGVAAGFSINGTVKWSQGAGYSDLDAKEPFQFTTVTRIASITKIMTAISIMQLYEAGKIDLDDPIQTYIPAFPIKPEGTITIRQLLHHTSGIGGYKNGKEQENMDEYASISDAMDIFKDRDLISVPGEAFNYTTYGYVVLGVVIEKVSGMTFVDFLQANIWNKLGMDGTWADHGKIDTDDQSGIYHRNSKGKIKKAKVTNLSDRIPGGGVRSTVLDLLKFGDGIINHTLVKESTLQLMIEDPGVKKTGNGYGFGLYLYGVNPSHGMVYGHNGSQTGASTFLMLLPERKTSVVVLSNTSGAMQTVSDITIALFDIAADSAD